MRYQVIKAFTDKNANSAVNGKKHIYWEDAKYPYKNYAGATTQARIEELIKGGYLKEVAEDGNEEAKQD